MSRILSRPNRLGTVPKGYLVQRNAAGACPYRRRIHGMPALSLSGQGMASSGMLTSAGWDGSLPAAGAWLVIADGTRDSAGVRSRAGIWCSRDGVGADKDPTYAAMEAALSLSVMVDLQGKVVSADIVQDIVAAWNTSIRETHYIRAEASLPSTIWFHTEYYRAVKLPLELSVAPAWNAFAYDIGSQGLGRLSRGADPRDVVMAAGGGGPRMIAARSRTVSDGYFYGGDPGPR